MERRGAGPAIVVGHSSGKWSQTGQPAFERNVRLMRKGRSIITRTEATARDFNAELNWPEDGWGLWHPRTGLGHDCAVEWDRDQWELIEHGVLQLTDFRVTTAAKHVKLDPCSLTWALLGHKATGIELEAGAAHLDLLNTPDRQTANREECRELRAHYVSSTRAHPQRRHLLQMDGNRNQKQLKWRQYFRAELMQGTGMSSGWGIPLPLGGTHGRSLLDLAIADFPLRSKLLTDDASSDHRPFESRGRL